MTHLVADDRLRTVGHFRGDLDAAVHRAGMHHERIGLGAAQALGGEAPLGEILGLARDRRGVLLTPAGEALVERARRLVVDGDAMVDAARRAGDPLSAPLRIGVIPTIAPYLLPDLTPRLRAYSQRAASFYGARFDAAQPFMSADYRLSAFSSLLLGCAVAVDLKPGLTLSLGASYQLQSGRDQVRARLRRGGTGRRWRRRTVVGCFRIILPCCHQQLLGNSRLVVRSLRGLLYRWLLLRRSG